MDDKSLWQCEDSLHKYHMPCHLQDNDDFIAAGQGNDNDNSEITGREGREWR
jgi:hypothetical protein